MKLLEDKAAIVTSGKSDIGLSVSLIYAREAAKVIVSDIDQVGGEQNVGLIQSAVETVFFNADVSSSNEKKCSLSWRLKDTAVCISPVIMPAL